MEFAKVLIIKGNYNSFERYYLNKMNHSECDALPYYNDRNMLSYLRKIWVHYSLPFEDIWYGRWKKKLKHYNVIIIFDSIFSPQIINYINRNRKRSSRFIFWHWNSLNTILLQNVYQQTKKECEHWTFDSGDEKQYNMKLNKQFFFQQITECKDLKCDIYFIGSDKGRYNQLSNLRDIFELKGISTDISILKDHTSKQGGDLYIYKPMQYEEILENIKKCKCVLELCQEGQTGLTVRALEAMFFNKKLITNNQSIVEEEFYDKNNILLIKDGWESEINVFLNSPVNSVNKELLHPYSFEGWIEKFDERIG